MSLESWMDQIVDNFLSMYAKASPSVRAEIAGRVTAAFTPQSPLDPGASPDTLPINQSSRVSHITRVNGQIVDEPGQENRHPHTRVESEDRFAMRRTKRLPLGQGLRDRWEEDR